MEAAKRLGHTFHFALQTAVTQWSQDKLGIAKTQSGIPKRRETTWLT
jgi:hypothetical protein